jgi:hypothetical protein
MLELPILVVISKKTEPALGLIFETGFGIGNQTGIGISSF